MLTRPLVAGLALALPLLGCNMKPDVAAPFELIIHVTSDPGHPLPGAIVAKAGKDGPATGVDGKVVVKLAGQEGETIDLTVKCPADYVSPSKPLPVLLRRNAGTKLAEYEATCPPTMRHMVVAVRADNGGNLPVKVLDRVVGYTDPNGAFTYALPLRPGDGIEMMLDTSGNPLLTPKNPSAILTMKPYDDVMTFDQKFNVKHVVHSAPVKRGPTEIRATPHRGY